MHLKGQHSARLSTVVDEMFVNRSIGFLFTYTALLLASLIGLRLSHLLVARQQAFFVCVHVCVLTRCCGNVRVLPVRDERDVENGGKGR